MPYSFKSKIRYSEVGSDEKLTIPAAINYMQDCSSFQSESLGVGLGTLAAAQRAWWISNWHIRFYEMPRLCDDIITSTWTYDFKGIYAYRNFRIVRCSSEGASSYLACPTSDISANEKSISSIVNGDYTSDLDIPSTLVAEAQSLWFFVNTSTLTPAKPDERFVTPYLNQRAPSIDMPAMPRKIAVVGEGEPRDRLLITSHFIDTNGHVNNAHYIDIARGVLPSDTCVRELFVQYKKAALMGNVICPIVYRADGEYVVRLADESGADYAVVKVVG